MHRVSHGKNYINTQKLDDLDMERQKWFALGLGRFMLSYTGMFYIFKKQHPNEITILVE